MVVAIDPGHGGYDEGIVYNSPDGNRISEKNVDLALALAMAADLRAGGAKVFLLRQADRYLGIYQRTRIASARRPALFLSVHLSSTAAFHIYVSLMPQAPVPPTPVPQAPPAPAAGTGAAATNTTAGQTGSLSGSSGQPTPQQQALRNYYQYRFRQRPYLPQSRDFASALEQSVTQAFPGKNVSYMEIPLPILDAMACPAVLLECPGPQFMDYTDPATVSGIARAVAGAIMTYGKE
ncbi:MAG: N-acetylmuramoyl-L-alanine amidase [Nitrospiraceae bacterium]|nr:N-acetylmuramoyl-L-alanine amidase [Nitrospiraceae bacterium]